MHEMAIEDSVGEGCPVCRVSNMKGCVVVNIG